MSDTPPSATPPQIHWSDSQSPYFMQVVSTITHSKNIKRLLNILHQCQEPMRWLKEETGRSRDRMRKNEASRQKMLADLNSRGLTFLRDTVNIHPLTLLVVQLGPAKRSFLLNLKIQSSSCRKQRPYSTQSKAWQGMKELISIEQWSMRRKSNFEVRSRSHS